MSQQRDSPTRSSSSSSSGTDAQGRALREWALQYSVETEPLGRGSFASVYKGVNRETNEPVAIKVMTKARLGERALKMLSAEINILRTLEHPNVVCLRDSRTTERRILIVLEFCGGGDLGQFIQARGPSPEATARHFMLQLAAGLSFLRSRRLIHRDIKPQNLLLSSRSSRASLKIADFGLARHLPQGSLAESMLGSPLYMALEVLSNRAYDAKADLWSAGVVLYELMTAKHPFAGTNQMELINNIQRNRPRLPPGVTLSPACVELLGMLLVPQPEQRATLEAFVSCAFLNPPPTTAPAAAAAGTPGPAATSTRTTTQRFSAAGPPAAAPTGRPAGDDATATAPPPREGGGDARGWTGPPERQQQQQQQQPCSTGHRARTAPGVNAAAEQPLRRQQQAGHAAAGVKATGAGVESSSGADRGAAAAAAAASGAASAGAAAGDGPTGDNSRNRENEAAVVAADPVGGRDGEWGWDWGGRGLFPPSSAGTAAAAAGSGAVRLGINDEGPLPALPALPFALEPFGVRGSFDGDGGGPGGRRGRGGGGDEAEMSAGFGFDLAFAGSPVHDRSRMLSAAADAPSGGGRSGGGGGVAGERERRSFSASDAAAAAHDARDTGPETGGRKRVDAAPPAAAPPLGPAGPSFPAGAEDEHALPVATPTRRHHRHRFSGKESPPHPVASSSRDSREVASPGPAAGYGGRGESVPSPSVSPAHTPATPQRHPTDQRHQASGHSSAGVSTPLSPAHFPGRLGDHASGVGVGGNTGGSPSRSGGACSPALGSQSSSSGGGGASMRGAGGGGGGGAGGRTSPARAPHVTTPAGPLGPAGVQPPLQPSPPPSSFDGGAQQQPPSLSATESSHGAGGGSGGPAVGDLGAAPVLLKPSFRGSDSLLTIPEDSTGFVLVTRPSSVSCEHGSHCECWAWSANAGGCAAAVMSPSASYLATASNPYGGPGKEAAGGGGGGGGGDRGGRRSGGGAFLGSIWNTAVNTFRGVAGGHGRRASWSAVRGRGGQQHRASVSPPTAAVSPAHVRGASSPRERQQQQHLSPHSNARKGVRVSGSPLGSPCSGRSSSDSRGSSNVVYTHRQGGDDGGKVAVVVRQANANAAVAAYRTDVPYQQGTGGSSYHHHHHHQPTSHPHHHRSHSEPPCARPYGSYNNPGGGVLEGSGPELYRGRGCGGSGGVNQVELVESQRVKAAADRAEVVGKRAILLVTLGDKTAQEAMALALESPSADADGGARAAAAAAVAAGRAEGGPAAFAAGEAHARRRHDMLTEALALYVKALALLQGALPGVLVVCEGVVPTEAFAAWNPLGKEGQQQQQQQHQRLGRPSPSSAKVVAERAALVTKAGWLKELFSQVLQRAEHCRAQAACAATAAAAAPLTASSSSSSSTSSSSSPCCPVPDDLNNPSSSEGSGVDGNVFGGMGKTGGGGGGGVPCGGSSGNPAVAAVYRSATEHGQEAAVCYMLGRSDAAVTHYVRACALLQLLALEPEMAGAGAVEDGRWRHHAAAAAAAAAAGEDRSQPQRQGRCDGWQAHLLGMADAYAQRVELISRGEGSAGSSTTERVE